jgi:Zn-dependent protease with chaperone function
MSKSQDMILLEECFYDIKSKNNVNGAILRIQRVIKRNFDINFTINIVNNDTREFFGMSIYPNKNQIEKIIDAIVNKKSSTDVVIDLWQKTDEWVLEIDSILLYDKNLNANPAEIVAVLLHEIGHVVYSNSIPQRVNRILRYKMMHANLALKKLISWPKAQKIIQLVFVDACSSKNFRYTNLKTERVADQFVEKMGYGENLNNFIDKLVATQGNRLVNRTEEQVDQDVTATVNWTFVNIAELEFRRSNLRTTLQTELLKNPSRFVRDIVYDIRSTFFGKGESENPYTDAVREQYLTNEFNVIVKEGLLSIFDKNGKVKKITQADIDILSVEVGRIENEDDKIYVLDLIYDKLSVINAALDLIKNGQKEKVPVSKDTLESFKAQLERMRIMALETPIKPKQYGVFIKYPKGYEG